MTLNPLSHIDPVGTVLFPLINIFFGGFLIGWMRPVPVHTPSLLVPRRHSLLVSIAGPFSNLLLAFASCVVLIVLLETELLTRNITLLLEAFLFINLLLAAFNLLPIPPLDGSSLVDYIRRDPNETYHRQGGIGIIILYALLLLGLLRYLWEGVFFAADVLLSGFLVPTVMLGLAAVITIFFTTRTGPGGEKRVKPRTAAGEGSAVAHSLKRARKIAAALIRGESIPEADRRWFDNLNRDRGNGEPLCSTVSFDTDNEFCRSCQNLNRCIVREAEGIISRGSDTAREKEDRSA
jgi:Zn-dependent protease